MYPLFLPLSPPQRDSPPSSQRPPPPHTPPAASTPHAGNPTDPFEFVPSPGRIEDCSNKSTGGLVQSLEEATTAARPCSEDTADHFNTEGEAEGVGPDVEHRRLKTEQTGTSKTLCVLPTPESLALADPPTPALEEVDAAWPAPSNGNADVAGAWGTGVTALSTATRCGALIPLRGMRETKRTVIMAGVAVEVGKATRLGTTIKAML